MRSSKRFSPEADVHRNRGRSQLRGKRESGSGSTRHGPPLRAPADIGPKSPGALDGTADPPASVMSRTGVVKSLYVLEASALPREGTGPESSLGGGGGVDPSSRAGAVAAGAAPASPSKPTVAWVPQPAKAAKTKPLTASASPHPRAKREIGRESPPRIVTP